MTLFLRVVLFGLLYPFVCKASFADALNSIEKSKIHFEYEMPPRDAAKLEAAVVKLKKGLRLEAVKAMLGKPTEERTLYKKRLFGGGLFIAYEISYYLKTVGLHPGNNNDHVIIIYFDKDHLLTEADRLGYSLTGKYALMGGSQIVEKIL